MFRRGIAVSGCEGTYAPHERRKKYGEQRNGIGKRFPAPQARTPLAEFHRKNIDFPPIDF